MRFSGSIAFDYVATKRKEKDKPWGLGLLFS
jgi:hypothetical protein